MARRLLWASLGLAPVTIVVRFATDASDVTLFVLAAIALIPLAWLIGEATEHAARQTGPGIGGFLNATFGNAPELIIALFAINDGLFDVVRGSLTGSVVGNLLLVLGFSLFVGPATQIDRRSALISIALVLVAVALFLVVAVPGWSGDVTHAHARGALDPGLDRPAGHLRVRHLVAAAPPPRAARGGRPRPGPALAAARSRSACSAVATVATAIVAEILVGSLEAFAEKAHLSDFFVAAVIVAIVGNAAEHGGAVIVAHRGRVKLATEIALSSSAQVAVFLIPAVDDPLVDAPAARALVPQGRDRRDGRIGAARRALLAQGRSSRWRGAVLIAAYVVVAAVFYKAGSALSRSRERAGRPRDRVGRPVELLDRTRRRRGRRGAARRARGPRRRGTGPAPRPRTRRRAAAGRSPPGGRGAGRPPTRRRTASPPSTTCRAARRPRRAAPLRAPRLGLGRVELERLLGQLERDRLDGVAQAWTRSS